MRSISNTESNQMIQKP